MTKIKRNKQSLDIAIERSNKLSNLINTGKYNYHKWVTCQKKRAYDTEFEAIDAFYFIKNTYPDQNHDNLTRYECQYCGKWHVGHNVKLGVN
jgi:hypothetical protein